jgi:hypothetical protein
MALVLWGIPLLPVAVLALLAALVYEARVLARAKNGNLMQAVSSDCS